MLKLSLVFSLLLFGATLLAAEAPTVAPPKTSPPGVPLELKLTSHRAEYAVDRMGKSVADYCAYLKSGHSPYGPAVVIMVELKNNGAKDIIAYGAPRPRFELHGPRAESVCEVAPTKFQAAPSRRYVVAAGKSVFLNVISFFNPAKDEPSVKDTIKRLSYSEGVDLSCVNWTEKGEYTLKAVLPIGVSPAPEKAGAFQKEKYAFPEIPQDIGVAVLESNTVKLTVVESSETNYWIEALDDPDPETRFVAAHTLTAAIPLAEAARLKMAAHVADADARVRKSAARALQKPAGWKVTDADALARDPAVVGLIGALKDANAGVRAFAVAALATWGRAVTATTPALIPLLRDPDPGVRLATADAFCELYREGGAEERALAEALSAALKDENTQVVKSAIVALGRLKSGNVDTVVLAFCKNSDAGISCAAIDAIGSAGPNAAAEEALFGALKVPATRAASATALSKMKVDAAKLLVALKAALSEEQDEFGRIAIVRALGSCGDAATPTLVEALKNDKESSVREFAASTLGAMTGAGNNAVSALTDALSDSNDDVKCSAAKALGRIGANAKSAVPALTKLSKSQSPDLKACAEEALNKIGGPSSK